MGEPAPSFTRRRNIRMKKPALQPVAAKKVIRPFRRRLIKPKKQSLIALEEDQKALQIEGVLRALALEIKDLPDDDLRDRYTMAMGDIAQDGDLSGLLELTKFKRNVVPLDEFLFGRAYFNLREADIYPGVLEALHDIDGEDYVEAVLKGAIGGGKTTLSNIGVARSIYKTSCMRDPQASFGVRSGSSLVFTIQSVRLGTAKKAVFEELGSMFNNSPYFTSVYPYDPRVLSQMIFRQQNITVLPVSSSDTGAISMNVIGGVLDEMNFMAKVARSKNAGAADDGSYDQAKNLYLNLSKRRRSRFLHKGKLPGMLFLVSSSRYPDDFTEVKAAEAAMCGGGDTGIYVYSKSLWEAKGDSHFTDGRFTVVLGDDLNRARIAEPNETLSEDADVLEVPEDLRSEFEKDMDGSIRDLGGRTTLAMHPFIQKRESIDNAMRLADKYGYISVFDNESVDLSISIPNAIESRVRTDVNQMRVCHIDLSITRDSCGLAVGHIAGTRTVERRDDITGMPIIEVLPVIAYDALLRIIPPRTGDEIEFSKIRSVIYSLKEEHGLPIRVVTTDGYQSVDFRQILGKKGYITDYLSVDKTTSPYISFRDALYDGRLLLPRHGHLVDELSELELVRNGAKEKVDHKPRGSKDVADAAAAVASYLLTRRNAWTQQPLYRGESGMLLHGNRTHIENTRLEMLSDDEVFKRRSGRRKTTRKPSPDRKSPSRRAVASDSEIS